MQSAAHYRTYRSYIRERFGRPVLKIPLNGGFSCPNRDGSLSRVGCAFCDNEAFSPVVGQTLTPVEQLRSAVERAPDNIDAFIAYLQPFSNTYAPVERLREVYEPIIAFPNVVGLAVGTRPDCLPEQVCDYLGDVSTRTYLSVELGLQSADERVLKSVNRGHTPKDFVRAVKRLAAQNIQVVAHVIIGLPGERAESVKDTAQFLAHLPIHGVKVHQLMIIEGTPLADLYRRGELQALSLESYTDYLGTFLRYLRPDLYMHRICADTWPDRGLLAPSWSLQKQDSLAFIRRQFSKEHIYQGEFFHD